MSRAGSRPPDLTQTLSSSSHTHHRTSAGPLPRTDSATQNAPDDARPVQASPPSLQNPVGDAAEQTGSSSATRPTPCPYPESETLKQRAREPGRTRFGQAGGEKWSLIRSGKFDLGVVAGEVAVKVTEGTVEGWVWEWNGSRQAYCHGFENLK